MKRVKANGFVNFIAGLVMLVSIGGCATSYQKSDFWGMDGYSSKVLSEDTVEVQYMVSQPWNFNKVSNFALLRAAEMTNERGFYSFKLLALREYHAGTSKIANCKVQFLNPPTAQRKLPETADEIAAYDLVGLGILPSGYVFVASELKRVIEAKYVEGKK